MQGLVVFALVLAGLALGCKALGGLWWLVLGRIHDRPRGARRRGS